MGMRSADSKNKVEAMKSGDFYGSENPNYLKLRKN
jgi:monomeric isocitrate dehydrogenase